MKSLLRICLTVLTLLLMSFSGHAQQVLPNNYINLTWDGEVACQVFEEGERKDILELIEDGYCLRVCADSRVTYRLSGEVSTWDPNVQWHITGGTVISSTTTTCVVAWGNAGTGEVSVSVVIDGQTENRTLCVEKLNLPKASFGVFPELGKDFVTVCSKEEIFFTNMSDANGMSQLNSHYWDFGDGTYSSEFEPSHMFASPGAYEISLTVSNSCNCTNTYKMTVKVEDQGLDIQCASVVCEDQLSTYSLPEETKEKCSKFDWLVENGTLVEDNGHTIVVKWDKPDPSGFGYVTFDPAQCSLPCTARSTIKIPVVPKTGHIVGESTVCFFSQNTYSLPQWPDTEFEWTLEDTGTGSALIPSNQLNMVHLQSGTPGMVKIKAVFTNRLLGCGGTAEIKINIKPKNDVFGPTIVCAGSNEMYFSSEIQDWLLEGPGNYQQTGTGAYLYFDFPTSGKYYLHTISDAFCDNEPFEITARQLQDTPQIVGSQQVCPNVPYTYNAVNSTNIPNTVLEWSVDNGTIIGSTYGDEVTVVFNSPGVNAPQIRVWRKYLVEPYCGSEPTSLPISYLQTGGSITGRQAVCESTYESYSVSYTAGDTYTWEVLPANLGSVTSVGSNGTQAQILWNENPGGLPATVRVIIRKCGIAQPPITLPVTFIPTPTPTITVDANPICRGSNILFSINDPALTSHSAIVWNFGDGTTGETGPNDPSSIGHQYDFVSTQNIQYTVTAQIYGANGCKTITVENTFTVIPSPVAKITPGSRFFCEDTPIYHELHVTAETGFGATVSSDVKWYRQGNPSVIHTGFNYTATSPGSYYAIVANEYGCTSETNVATVGHKPCPGDCDPAFSLSLQSSNDCGTITVNAFSDGPLGTVTFMGPQTATNVVTTPHHYQATFEEAGLYTVYASAVVGGCRVGTFEDVLVPYIANIRYKVDCGATPDTYDVTLFDSSNYFPSVSITNRVFRVNGSIVYSGTDQQTVVNLPANASYTFSIEIVGTDGIQTFPACTTQTTLNLPSPPNVQVLPVSSVCPGSPIQFTVLNGSPDYTYLWDFGDGSQNTLPNPSKTYSVGRDYDVILTVKNNYGCSQTVTLPLLRIFNNNLNGSLVGPPLTCMGSSSQINFNQSSFDTPASYIWMNGTTQVGQTSVPSFSINQSGRYWVRLVTSDGCETEIDGVTALFAKPPVVKVVGPSAVCAGEGFTLSANAGPNVYYNWSLTSHSQLGNSSAIQQMLEIPGVYEYQVTATKVQNGVSCSTTVAHTVTILENPTVLDASFTMMDCEKYTIKLSGDAGEPGHYTWSNGSEGQSIEVTVGGAYQVRFTNLGGCSITKEIFVPRNPEEYLWVFPKGCYNLCDKENATLIGPFPHFAYWEWQLDDHTLASGTETVEDLTIKDPGTYHLILDNGFCKKQSATMHVSMQKCECEYKVEFNKIKVRTTSYCSYSLDLHIDNPFGYPVDATIYATNGEGVFTTSIFNIPVSGGIFPMTFIPNAQFNGGSISISIKSPLQENEICYFVTSLDLPECGGANNRKLGTKDESLQSAHFKVYPNPVDAFMTVDFAFDSEKDAMIEIYGLSGALMEQRNVSSRNGHELFDITKYASGQYIVVLKENGYITAQKLIIKK